MIARLAIGFSIFVLYSAKALADSADIPQSDLERLAVLQIEQDHCSLNQEGKIRAEIKRLARKYRADPDEFRAMVGQLSVSATRYIRPVTLMHYCGEREGGGRPKTLEQLTR